MRILFVIGSLREGGAEGQVLMLMRALRERGHDVALMLLRTEGARLEAARAEGLNIFSVRLPVFRPRWSPLPWLRMIAALRRSRRFLKRYRPDVIHAYLFWAHLWAWMILPRAPRIPFVTSRRQMESDTRTSRFMTTMERIIDRRADLVIANSRRVADAARLRNNNLRLKLRTIYNGIDVERIAGTAPKDLRAEFPQLRDASLIAVTVANVLPHKGYLDLVAAWKFLHATHPDLAIICIGEKGSAWPEVERAVGGAGLSHRIIFPGTRMDAVSFVRAADFCVHASHDEGFSNAVLEYLASGKACVVTDVGGNAEAVGTHGIVVAPRRPEVLAEGVQRLLTEVNREAMGAQAQADVRRRFSIKTLVERHLVDYKRLIERR